MYIYADLVILLNTMVDFLLLLGTNRLAGFPTEFKRAAAASVLGGLYGGVCLIPQFRFLGNLLWRMVCLVGMAGLAFGWNRSAVKRCGVFVLLSMALGGMAFGVGKPDFAALVLSATGLWFLCRVAFGGGTVGKSYVPLELRLGERCIRVMALRDTGNTLRDPITGQQVFVLSPGAASRLTGLQHEQLVRPLETLAQRPLPGLRLIPYHSVGCAGGMLLAMGVDYVKVGSRVQRAVIAFAPSGLGEGEVYQALIGGMA